MLSKDYLIRRNNITQTGTGQRTLLMAHGFGSDHRMWRSLLPLLEDRYRIILFDYVGSGQSMLSAFERERYAELNGYARDIIEICEGFELSDVTLVGHSVSGSIAMLAAQAIPYRVSNIVMVCPSPCFLNAGPDYSGGFEKADLEELMDLMDKNYIGWAHYLAPLVTGASVSEELRGELADSFCSTDPLVAKTFARATFFTDLRHRLPHAMPPALLLQSERDTLAPVSVGQYMDDHMLNSELVIVDADGHCLHMTDPEPVAEQIKRFVPPLP